MSDLVVVPDRVVPWLRSALLLELGDAAADFADIVAEAHPTSFARPVRRIDDCGRLLARIGLPDTPLPPMVLIDMTRDQLLITLTLQRTIEITREQLASGAIRRRRREAKRGIRAVERFLDRQERRRRDRIRRRVRHRVLTLADTAYAHQGVRRASAAGGRRAVDANPRTTRIGRCR